MGVTQSYNTYTVENKNTYDIIGTGNSMNSPNSTGDLSNSGTTDVKPSTTLKYSEDINPGFGGISMYNSHGKLKVRTTIEHNVGVISTARHVITSRIDSSMYDPDVVTECLELNGKINAIAPNDAIKGNVQLNSNVTEELVNCYGGIVENLDMRSNAWHSTFAISGIRNNEVTTKPTRLGLQAAYCRLDDHERDNAESVLTTLGPRFGIVNRSRQLVPSDLSTKKIEDISTKFGRYGDLKVAGDTISKAQDSLLFSRLHTKHGEIINTNWYSVTSFETHNLFGILQESTGYYNHIDAGTGNYRIIKEGKTKVEIEYSNDKIGSISLLPVCFQRFQQVDNRQVELILTGNIEILKGVWSDSKPTRIGLLYKKREKYHFQPGILLGSSVVRYHENKNNPGPSSNIRKNTDVKEILLNDPRCRSYVGDDGETLYNYRSDFYVSVIVNDVEKFRVGDIVDVEGSLDYENEVTVYIIGVNCPLNKTYVRVDTPSVRAVQYGPPSFITLVGERYDGKVLDLLGQVPEWYRSDDPLDATNIFLNTVSPLFPYLTRMSQIHTGASSGSYELTMSIVKYEREYSGLSKLDDEELREHIMVLITSLREWLYVSHPITEYKVLSRRHLFMRLFETICFQLMSHINVYAPRTNNVITNYNSDVKTYLEMESKIDRAVLASQKAKELIPKIDILFSD